MKTVSLIVSILIASAALHAQSTEQRIAYFDKRGNRLSNETGAIAYRTATPSGDIFLIRDYTIAGRLYFEAECSEYTPKLIYHGKMKRYFDNGKVSEEGNYKDGANDGEVTFYYRETGKPKERVEYVDKKTRYKQIFSEDGQEMLVNGRGVITDKDDNGETIYTLLRNYEYFSCYKLNGKDSVFLTLYQEAEYPGGVTQLSQDISSKIKYPKSARKAGIEGTVYVQFIINKSGGMEDIEIIRGIGAECDAEALRVISELKTWKPGIQRGKVMKSRYVLPLKFGLSG